MHKRTENALFGCMWGRALTLVAVLLLVCSIFAVTPRAYADEKKAEEQTTEESADSSKKDEAEDKKDDKADTAEDAAAEELIAPAPSDNEKLPAGVPDDALAFGNDVLWSGSKADFQECIITNDILGAGETINVGNASVGGSIRLAGRILAVTNSMVVQNATMAGQEVSFNSGSVNTLAMAGQDLTFTGTASKLYLAGGKVVINGTVTGDVNVLADTLEIGPDAVIKGTLSGRVTPKSVISPDATIGQNKLEYVEEKQSDDIMSLFDWPIIAISAASCLLIALIIEWIAGGFSASAAELLKERPVSYLLSGILGVVFVPLALVLLCVPIVTIPAVVALVFVVLALLLISGGFMAALFARLLFPKGGRYITTAILGLIFGALMAMPYVGYPLRLVGYIFTLGYSVCAMRKGMKERRDKRNEELIQF